MMKTRIQKAGGEFGGKEGVVWQGDLPFIPAPHQLFRIVVTDSEDNTAAYKPSQVALEINAAGDLEQVLYVGGQVKREALLG